MTKQNKKEKTDGSQTRSSMSISMKIVCEGDECIGNVAKAADSPPTGTGGNDKKKSNGSSMSIGGKEICTDDGCIGKE